MTATVGRQCGGCGELLSGRQKKWCSERCRRRTLYSGACIDCGVSTYNGTMPPPDRCIPCAGRYRAIWSRETLVRAIQAWAAEHGGIPPSATDWNPPQAIAVGHPEKAEKFYADDAWPRVSVVQDYFGSWNDGIRAAGFVPRQPSTYGRDGEDLSLCLEIRRRYDEGEVAAVLAEEYGVTPSGISYRIQKAGGKMRSATEAQQHRWRAA